MVLHVYMLQIPVGTNAANGPLQVYILQIPMGTNTTKGLKMNSLRSILPHRSVTRTGAHARGRAETDCLLL
eukprot:COSAG02_NODE_1181_length_14030_cov_6.652143_4_plen_71_part_00